MSNFISIKEAMKKATALYISGDGAIVLEDQMH